MNLNKYDKIIDYDSGDLTGDGNKEEVYVVSCLGSVCEQNNFLVVHDKKTGNIHEFPLEKDHYKFEMYLISFRDSIKKEIFLRSIGESFGGYVKCQIFSFENNRIVEIFNSNTFYKENKIMAFYRDNYELEVLNYERNKKYFVVLRENYKYYLDFVYDDSGKVKTEKEKANISRVWECYPFYQMGNEVASIGILQKILGQSDTDIICLVQSIISYRDKKFELVNQTVNLKGNFINQNYRNKEICIEEGCFNIVNGIYEDDPKIKEAIKKELNFKKDDFKYVRYNVDLNNDGTSEIFIYLKDWYFCNINGCKAFVLKESNGKFEVIGNFTGVSYPIIISNKKTNGYKDLILYISGVGIENGYRVAKFNGEKYPENVFLEKLVPIDEIKKENIHGVLLEEYYDTNEGELIIDTKIKRLDLVEVVKRFINKDSEILFANEVDINNDGNKEIIAAYRYAKGLYLIILEEVKGEWGLVDIIKGHGYNVNKIIIAPLESKKRYMIVVWELSDMWRVLDIYFNDKYGLHNYLTLDKPFNNVDVKDINNNGVFELAIWTRDSGDAYKIEIYRVKNNNLINARDLYEKYFKNLIKYYSGLVDKNPSVPIYWYYLANSQFISGSLEDALKSINMDLSFQYPYPSKEEALLLKEKIEVRLKKEKISRSLR